jgi:DNA-directed RNA polymerase subunit RPC12/RpoP
MKKEIRELLERAENVLCGLGDDETLRRDITRVLEATQQDGLMCPECGSKNLPDGVTCADCGFSYRTR